MTTYHACPVFDCGWFRSQMASPSAPDSDADVPQWCTPTWAIASGGYGTPLTDAQVIGAHMATHTAAEQAGRMPSRGEVEADGIPVFAMAGVCNG